MCDFCFGNGLVINLPHNVHVCNSCFDNLFCSNCSNHVDEVGPTQRFGNEFWCNDCINHDEEMPELNWDDPPVGGWTQNILQQRPIDFDNNMASSIDFNPDLVHLLTTTNIVNWYGYELWAQADDIYNMDNEWIGAIFGNTIAWA